MTLLQARTFLVSNDEWSKITWTGEIYYAMFYDNPTTLYLSHLQRWMTKDKLNWPSLLKGYICT